VDCEEYALLGCDAEWSGDNPKVYLLVYSIFTVGVGNQKKQALSEPRGDIA
jgi:hypothetical protein